MNVLTYLTRAPFLRMPFFGIMALSVVCVLSGGTRTTVWAKGDTYSYRVRVAVAHDAPALTVSVLGDYEIVSLPVYAPLKEGKGMSDARITPSHSGIVLDGEELMFYGIRIRSVEGGEITVNNRTFRGEMDILRTEKMSLMAINHIDIEDYVKGVLYHEVSHWWPMEALKAQAIASRTFAVYKTQEQKESEYDLRSDVFSQVYGGHTSETYRTSRAVDETRDKILIYRNRVLPAYFHATCGGHTEDASELWKTECGALHGRPCRYCEVSPHYRWTGTITAEEAELRLRKAGYTIRHILSFATRGLTDSGRVKEVLIKDELGVEKISAPVFRLALGPDIIRSTAFSVSVSNDGFVFSGKGWGHGVGMCQWGAYGMASRGLDAVDILRFYYPGAKCITLRECIAQ